ncbi:ricin B-like lectin R40C1 [Selaginella moellendorffii]|uniref:ricin B-like lectin R40C1 n=1 Tax=Selaginella moellendorffii TaxID=88036 RepID=UPI000D1CB0A8|nr:ricin B-like lectin R40C1 [Selaginella moellendorffii]|eukprot:XP_024530056.1 ricin B-like lectin R40C1 [Selaginella moellendorffii]
MAEYGGYGGAPDTTAAPYGSGPEYSSYGGGRMDESEPRGFFHHDKKPGHEHHHEQPHRFDQENVGGGYGEQQQQSGYHSRPGGGGGSAHEEVFKIVCEANPSYYLTDRGGELVLAPGNESNPHQQWYKDTRHSSKKDKEGFPGFSVINKASGLALYHDDKKDKVYLKPYDANDTSESFLWSQSADVGHGYQCIRPFTDVHLNLDAYRGDKEHGGVKDGTTVILHKWNKQENQKWKILPITSTGAYGAEAQSYGTSAAYGGGQGQSYGQQTVKLSCEARPDYYVTVRGDSVVLAASEESDPRQEWFQDNKLAANMKDESGSPAFVLINKATQKALQHGEKEFDKVRVVSLHGDRPDESVLWTLSADVGKGYRCLRPVGNIHLNLDASHGDEKHGGVHDGTELILFKWLKRENQKWRLTYL